MLCHYTAVRAFGGSDKEVTPYSPLRCWSANLFSWDNYVRKTPRARWGAVKQVG